MTEETTPREQAISQAMDWLLRLQTEPESEALRQRHRQWLEASELHRDAWEQARVSWRLLRALPPRGTEATGEPNPAAATAAARPPRRRSRVHGIAAVAIAACLLVALLPGLLLHWRADQITPVGVTRLVNLPDGSQAHLGADSAIQVDFADGARRVTLLRGEAFFDVTRDPRHPFVVRAEQMEITVLGTRFNVAIGALSDTVSVASGKVRVTDRGTDQPRPLADLLPGQQLSLSHDGEVRQNRLAIEDVGGWRQRRLFVVDAAIADVIATLRRYDDHGIVLTSEALGARRVTGAYDLSTPERALNNLVEPHQGKVFSTPLLPHLVLP